MNGRYGVYLVDLTHPESRIGTLWLARGPYSDLQDAVDAAERVLHPDSSDRRAFPTATHVEVWEVLHGEVHPNLADSSARKAYAHLTTATALTIVMS